jgi:glutathione S-transferase
VEPALAEAMLAYGAEHAHRWLKVLDEHMLGGRDFVCGDEITVADYLGASFVTLGEIADFDLAAYPNILAWLGRMRGRAQWAPTYAMFYGMAAMIRGAKQAA